MANAIGEVIWYECKLECSFADREYAISFKKIERTGWRASRLRDLLQSRPETYLWQDCLPEDDFKVWYNSYPMWIVSPRSATCILDDRSNNGELATAPIQFPDVTYWQARGRNNLHIEGSARENDNNPLGCWTDRAERREAVASDIYCEGDQLRAITPIAPGFPSWYVPKPNRSKSHAR